jgi:hypothetical protein
MGLADYIVQFTINAYSQNYTNHVYALLRIRVVLSGSENFFIPNEGKERYKISCLFSYDNFKNLTKKTCRIQD